MHLGVTWAIVAAELTPTDRWNAAGRLPEVFVNWVVWGPAIAALAVGIVLVVVYRHWSARREMLQRFAAHADRLGLTRNERAVLDRAAALSGAKDFGAALADRDVFNRGVRGLMASETVTRLAEEQRLAVAAVVETLRTKLDLGHGGGAEFLEDGGGLQIGQGDGVTVVRRGDVPPIEARVARLEGRDLTLELTGEATLNVGEPCLVRFVRQDIQWELGASVKVATKGVAVARLIGEQRCVNLRRFARVPTRKPALLARFPFGTEAAPAGGPEFVSGTLTEIAGPGLRIDAPAGAQVGERVLVVLEMGRDKTIQGVGKVRRLLDAEGETPVIIVEMVGLSQNEVAELVRETRTAARAAEYAPPDAEPVAAAAHASEGV